MVGRGRREAEIRGGGMRREKREEGEVESGIASV